MEPIRTFYYFSKTNILDYMTSSKAAMQRIVAYKGSKI